jgi:predicted DNA binding protein
LVHYEVGFKLRHDCPFNNLSKQFPSVLMAWWTNYDQDVLEVGGGEPGAAESYNEKLQTSIAFMGGRVLRRSRTESTLQLVIGWDGSKYEYSTSKIFTNHNCLVLQPTVHTQGWEWYRFIAFSDRDVRSLFKELDKTSEVVVVSKKTVEEGSVHDTLKITASNLLGDLTTNQANALLVALDSGYYSIPKKATTKGVADRVGVPRTTYEEHLRKAESKVMLSVAPYVHFMTGAKPQDNAALCGRRSTAKK